MPASLHVPLTDELHEFVKNQSGNGTPFASSDEFVRALIREKQEKLQAAQFRRAVLEGYQDIIEGRVVEYKGSVRDVIRQAKRKI